jgi:hypothetical protein
MHQVSQQQQRPQDQNVGVGTDVGQQHYARHDGGGGVVEDADADGERDYEIG